jgi:formylglycine-generating enzyme required for sulfatase activity
MQFRLSFLAICMMTLSLLTDCGESSAQDPMPAVAPFGTEQAKIHQRAWADHLGVPVEVTNSIGMKFVVIPPGVFTMGSPAEIRNGDEIVQQEEPGHGANEIQHTVTLSRAFSIGITEVTQRQYKQLVARHKGGFSGADHPMENISWNNAIAFCEKLSTLPGERAAGRVYRLPTEAEWEYACRAGTTTAYSFGDDAAQLAGNGWYDMNADWTTHPVGEKRSNPWGLFDMHGNVWEWCSNWYNEYPHGATTDPQGAAQGIFRVYRGGSWTLDATKCRSANRHVGTPSYRSSYTGFRLALNLPIVKVPGSDK